MTEINTITFECDDCTVEFYGDTLKITRENRIIILSLSQFRRMLDAASLLRRT